MGNCTGKKAAKKAGEVNPPQVNDVQGQQEAVVTPKKKKPSVPPASNTGTSVKSRTRSLFICRYF